MYNNDYEKEAAAGEIAQRLVGEVAQAGRSAAQGAKNLGRRAVSSAGEGARQVASVGRRAGKAVGEGAKTVGSKAQEAAKAVGSKTQEAAKAVGSKTQEAAKAVGSKTQEAAKAVGSKTKEVAQKGVETAKAHPFASMGIAGGAGALGGLGAGYAIGRKKEASVIADAVLEKVAFAVTDEGHAWDAARAADKEKYYASLARALMDKDALGYRTDEGDLHRGRIGKALRFADKSPVAVLRRLQYIRKKHEGGSNAWNPWGGMLTPHELEGPGATRWRFGKIKDSE